MTTAILNGTTLQARNARAARQPAPKKRFYFGPFAKQIAELDAQTERVKADIVALGQIRARLVEELCNPTGRVVETPEEKEPNAKDRVV